MTGCIERMQVICLKESHAPFHEQCCRHEDLCVQTILSIFHSTGVLNYLTGTLAVSLYPYTTFVQRRVYLTRQFNVVTKKALWKYKDRDLAIHDLGDWQQMKRSQPMRKVRYLGDKFCWRIKYGDQGVSQLPAPISILKKGFAARLWWSMDIGRDRVQSSTICGYLYGEGEAHKESCYIMSNFYRIACHGRLLGSQMEAYDAVAHYSAAHEAHISSGHAKARVFLCTCEDRFTCITDWYGADLRRRGAWTCDRVDWATRAWSVWSVGSHFLTEWVDPDEWQGGWAAVEEMDGSAATLQEPVDTGCANDIVAYRAT